MKLLQPTACDFMVHKDDKNRFKTYLSSMWNQHQGSTRYLFSYQSSCHHLSNYFLKPLPCEFPHRILHQLLIIHLLINDMLLSNFIQTWHTDGDIWTKNNLFVQCDGVFGGFLKLFFWFHAVSTRYIQLFRKF